MTTKLSMRKLGPRARSVERYGLAVAFVGAALVLRWMLGAWVAGFSTHGFSIYVTFYPAVVLVALLAGIGPGALATFASALAASCFVLPPMGHFAISGSADALGLIFFLLTGVFMSWVAGRAAEHTLKLEQTTEQLEVDVAQRIQTEGALTKATARFNGIISSAMDAIISIDAQQRIVLFNPAAEEMFGVPALEAMGQPLGRFIPERFRTAHESHVQRYGRTGVSTRHMGVLGEISGLRANGKEFPIEASISQVLVAGERIFTVILRDITERKRAEDARAAKLAAIVESSDDAILSKDLEGRITSWNGSAERLFGYRAKEMLGQRIDCIIPPERETEELTIQEQLCRGEHVKHYETIRRAKGGGLIAVSLTASPLRDASGAIVGVAKIIRDISERKRAEAVLLAAREAAERRAAELAALMEAVPVITFVTHDRDCRTMTSSRATRKLLRVPDGVSVSKSALEPQRPQNFRVLKAGREVAVEQMPMQVTAATGREVRNCELDLEFEDGTMRTIFGNVVPLLSENGEPRGAVGAFADITERKRTEEALLRQNQRLHLLNEAAALLILGSDPEGALGDIYERIAGYFQTSGFFEFEMNERGDELFPRFCLGVGESERDCGIARLKVGDGIIGLVAQKRIPICLEHVQASEDSNAQIIKRLGILAYACYPLLAGGRLLGTLSFASRQRDTFEQEDREFFETLASYLAMSKERYRLSNELRQHAINLEATVEERTTKLRETVADLEHFSYTITHDLRAPLRAMQGFGEILMDATGGNLSAEQRGYLIRITTAAERMDRLITDALNYGALGRQEFGLEAVDVEGLLLEIIASYPGFRSPEAEIEIESPIPPVLANRAGLTQCFSNLLNNAAKFHKPNETPRVLVRSEERGNCVRLWFEDEGIGIAPEYQERIFQMFQRLNSDYPGTGIGLALVRKTSQRMGGQAGVESVPGVGSKFWLEFKKAPAPEEQGIQGVLELESSLH